MSGTVEANKSNYNRRNVVFVVVVIILILLLAYGGGFIALPVSILSNYQSRNCKSALSLYEVYSSIYPSFAQDETLDPYAMECALYKLAETEETAGAWRASHNAYRVYESAYPNGVFRADAREKSAAALIRLAEEQVADGKFDEALGGLNLVLSNYTETDAYAEAVDGYWEIHQAWSADLRDAGDFEGAERVFENFKTWAVNNQKTEFADRAQRELAQIYLEWGQALQSQKQFDKARAVIDLALSIDPAFSPATGSAAQSQFYTEWGDYLIEQKDYAGAMERYETAVALSDNQVDAQDILAHGYIQWSAGLSNDEDFIGALALLGLAGEKAVTDSTKNLVNDARSDVHLAFSKSSGEQAGNAVEDAVAIVCKHQVQPSLPIFGLNQENILAGSYGIDNSLPENVVATTPGSLHYVACINEETKVVGSTVNAIGSFLFDPNPPYTTVKIQYYRHQYIWTVVLRKVDTGEEIESRIIEGGDPPPFPTTPQEIYEGAKNPNYFGSKPDSAELTNWLLSVLE